MYISHLDLKAFRTFRTGSASFVHRQQDFGALRMPEPKLPNMNLLLGNNGAGKSSMLRAIALAALGPAIVDSGIFPDRLVRREPKGEGKISLTREAALTATFRLHEQDLVISPNSPRSKAQAQTRERALQTALRSDIRVFRKTDLEQLRWVGERDAGESRWEGIYSAQSQAFFIVGYGATRRVERVESAPSARERRVFERAHRVMGLFEDDTPLVPLGRWLPAMKASNRGRHTQVVNLIDRLIKDEGYRFAGRMEGQEYLFERDGLAVPFRNLSDGYRAYLGWICDLLYHMCVTCPPGRKLVDNVGLALVDEVDLHLHPRWQMNVLQTLSTALPNIQFIVTSHSPLVVGSLEWMNILAMQPGPRQSSVVRRLAFPVHGLDADQVLLTDFFGLSSTRAKGKTRQLKDLSLQARAGDTGAALQLLEQMSAGSEPAR